MLGADWILGGASDHFSKFVDSDKVNKGLPEDASDFARDYDDTQNRDSRWMTFRDIEEIYPEDSKQVKLLSDLRKPGNKFLYKDDIRVIVWP